MARKRKKRRTNPGALTTVLAVAAGVAAVGAGYAGYRYNERRKKHAALKGITPEEALQGVIGNSTLEEAASMVADIRQPILLQTPPDPLPIDDEFDRVAELRIKVMRPQGETTIEEPAGAAFGMAGELGEGEQELLLVDVSGDFEIYTLPQKAIAYLITGLSPASAQLAYELATVHIADKGVNWLDMAQQDAATQKILATIAPKIDWSQGLKPYTYGSSAWKAWVGVQTVGTVANQSHFNKLASS